jgi:hypothetical protein
MRMRGWKKLLGTAALALTAGCEQPQVAVAVNNGPPDGYAQRAVEALLPGLQFGPDATQHAYRELRKVEVAGAHFSPGGNRWVVHYCVDFVSFASDELQRRCDMSVQVYELDSEKWVGFATGAGTLYRWQVLEDLAPPAPGGGAQAAAPEVP